MCLFELSVQDQEPHSSIRAEELLDHLRLVENDANRYRWLRNGGLNFLDYTRFDSVLVFAEGEDLDLEIDHHLLALSDHQSNTI